MTEPSQRVNHDRMPSVSASFAQVRTCSVQAEAGPSPDRCCNLAYWLSLNQEESHTVTTSGFGRRAPTDQFGGGVKHWYEPANAEARDDRGRGGLLSG